MATKISKYERLEARAFKAFHKRNHGEGYAALRANQIYWAAYDKGWFKGEDYLILKRLSACLDAISNGTKAPENVYNLFALVREM